MATARVKEKFRDWNLYHKIVAAGIAAMVFWTVLRALFVIDTAFEVQDERVLNAEPAAIWPFVVENQLRDNWTAELVRVQGVSVEVGRNRFLYWKRRYQEWRSYEVTSALVHERVFHTVQSSDEDERWWEVELEPVGPCQTRVKLRELIRPIAYEDRFWFFRVQDERQQRLAISLDALNRQLKEKGGLCEPPQTSD
jgi:hypothetical protein